MQCTKGQWHDTHYQCFYLECIFKTFLAPLSLISCVLVQIVTDAATVAGHPDCGEVRAFNEAMHSLLPGV
jgi:hypothetical protein